MCWSHSLQAGLAQENGTTRIHCYVSCGLWVQTKADRFVCLPVVFYISISFLLWIEDLTLNSISFELMNEYPHFINNMAAFWLWPEASQPTLLQKWVSCSSLSWGKKGWNRLHQPWCASTLLQPQHNLLAWNRVALFFFNNIEMHS